MRCFGLFEMVGDDEEDKQFWELQKRELSGGGGIKSEEADRQPLQDINGKHIQKYIRDKWRVGLFGRELHELHELYELHLHPLPPKKGGGAKNRQVSKGNQVITLFPCLFLFPFLFLFHFPFLILSPAPAPKKAGGAKNRQVSKGNQVITLFPCLFLFLFPFPFLILPPAPAPKKAGAQRTAR